MPEVIFDTPKVFQGKRWSHITCSDVDYLHEFVKRCGMKRYWFQNKPGHPHYDTYSDQIRVLLVMYGATQVDRKSYAMKVAEWHRNGIK